MLLLTHFWHNFYFLIFLIGISIINVIWILLSECCFTKQWVFVGCVSPRCRLAAGSAPQGILVGGTCVSAALGGPVTLIIMQEGSYWWKVETFQWQCQLQEYDLLTFCYCLSYWPTQWKISPFNYNCRSSNNLIPNWTLHDLYVAITTWFFG